MKTKAGIKITKGEIDKAEEVYARIPEFDQSKDLRGRLKGKQHLVLVIYEEDDPVGIKIGYKAEDHFYSWIGGILPGSRRKHYASKLAEYQEQWLKTRGVKMIRMKTQNRFTSMLRFAIGNGFIITDVEKKDNVLENRILLEKKL
jgi:GNAT superfamily N-acetyltransferase